MTKTSSRAERRKIAKSAHIKIYRGLVDYLIGPKWNGAKYQIGSIKSKLNALGIITVDTGFYGCEISIYFFMTRIKIYVKYRNGFDCEPYKTDYTFTDFTETCNDMPDDIDAYILRTKTFLQELLRHCANRNKFPNKYLFEACANYSDCIDNVPANFPIPFGMFYAAVYHYNSADTETIDTMIEIFKSKQFKRYRGDNN